MVQMAGSPAAISEAKVGPESAATRGSSHTSVMIWLTRSPVEISSPLLMLRTGTPGAEKRASVFAHMLHGESDQDIIGI